MVANYEPIDVLFRLAENNSIVLLNGGGFDGPQWSVRISMANLMMADYEQIGSWLAEEVGDYKAEFDRTALRLCSRELRKSRSSPAWRSVTPSAGHGLEAIPRRYRGHADRGDLRRHDRQGLAERRGEEHRVRACSSSPSATSAGRRSSRRLNRTSLKYFTFTGIEVVSVLAITAVATKMLNLDAGTAAGLMAGGATESAVVGTATDAIGKLTLPSSTISTLQANVGTAYSISYICGLITIVLLTSQIAPAL